MDSNQLLVEITCVQCHITLRWLCSGHQVPNSHVPVKISPAKGLYVLHVKSFQLTEQIQVDRHVPIALRPRSRIDCPRGPGHYTVLSLHDALEG